MPRKQTDAELNPALLAFWRQIRKMAEALDAQEAVE